MRTAIVFAALLAACADAQTAISLPKGFRPTAIASADFNGDGNADVAVAGLGAGQVIVLLGDGRGGLRATPPIAAGANPAGMDATKAFIAVANHETDYVTLLTGNGKGGFTPCTMHLHSKPHPHAEIIVATEDEDRLMIVRGR